MKTAWAHLPNAKYIDQLISNILNIDSVTIQNFDDTYNAACDVACEELINMDWNKEQVIAWNRAYETAWDIAHKHWEDNCEAAWKAITGALLFLVAYDEVPILLNEKLEDVKKLALDGNFKAIMLYPLYPYMLLRSEMT